MTRKLKPSVRVRYAPIRACATCNELVRNEDNPNSGKGDLYCRRPGGPDFDYSEMSHYMTKCDRWRKRQ